jgi:UDPglucose 6-dehydrogenase
MGEGCVSINIIGYGFVGAAMGFLCESNNVKFNICDTQQKTGKFQYFTSDIQELIKHSESKNDINYYFICVPTPSNSEGECDISIIHNILSKLNTCITKKTNVIIKSTMAPGSCDTLQNTFTNLDIVLCPEFLKEMTFKDDIYNASFVLLGLSQQSNIVKYAELINLFKTLYAHNSDINIIIKTYKECELFKYTLNTYFATKITFFNEIYELCESMNVDYQNLKSMFSLEPRIGDYGITVPGDDGRGFSKSCLPKEVKGMIKLQEKLDLSSDFMTCVDKRNNYFRSK